MVQFKTLKELDCSTDTCAVKVRVVHFWKQTHSSNHQTNGFNLLLLDDKGNRIQAVVPENIAAKVQQIFTLGKVHVLHSFAVNYYKSDEIYKCINYDKYIFLTEDSVIEEKPELELSIEQNAFDFYRLDQLSNLANIDIFLTDVIGVLHVEKNIVYSTQQILNFELRDHRTVVKATFSGGLAMLLHYKMTQETHHPIIIILGSAKVSMFQGNVHISNAPAIMFYLNYKHEAISRLQQMIQEKLYTISEIQDFGIMSEQAQLHCIVHLKKIETKSSFYFYHCTSCNNQINNSFGTFQCHGCKRVIPYPEQRLECLATFTDNTGEMTMQIPQELICKITGMHAKDLIIQEEQKSNKLIKNLKNLQGKKFKVKILLHADEVEIGKKSFIVVNFWNAETSDNTNQMM